VRTKKSWALGMLLVGALSLAASVPVAMRVEVEPLRQVGDRTEVAVVVQVSPEDRVRIGSNAILRIELDGGVVSSGSPMRAVRLEDDGSTRVVIEWPPGTHQLRVEIEDPTKEDTGLWVGTVRIPDLSPDASVEEVPEPDSGPASESASAPASENPEPETPPPTGVKGTVDTSAEAAAASTLTEAPTPEPSSEPVPTVDEPEDAESIAETAPEPPRADAPAIVESAAVGAAAMPEMSEPVTNQEPVEIERSEPEPVAESAPEEAPVEEIEPTMVPPEKREVVPEPEGEGPVTEDGLEPQVEAEEQPPLVEPLRAEPPPQTAAPEPAAPPQPEEPAAPVSAALAARYEEWGNAEPDIREFSLTITRGREPAMDIEPIDVQLRVGGSRVPVERLGGVKNAPLLLGLAIDVAADEADNWPGMQGSLSPIVGRAGGGRGRLFVATPDSIGAWGTEPDAPTGGTESQISKNAARLVIASIERFKGMHGRTFLVVLTDGRNEPAREDWQEATEAAGEAGVPILVIALWDDAFNQRTRKNLKKLTEVSGGSLFLVQGKPQLESAADRFGRFLDGGYSLRFRSPAGDRQTVTSISVTASDKDLDVSAPKSVR